MRHHGRAEDAGGEDDAVCAFETRDGDAVADFGPVRVREERLERKGQDDHQHHGGYRRFEGAVPPPLHFKDGEARKCRDDGGRNHADAEDQVQAECRSDEFGKIGRDDDELALDPEEDRRLFREAVACHFREITAGRDAELRGHRLDQDRHQIREGDHP